MTAAHVEQRAHDDATPRRVRMSTTPTQPEPSHPEHVMFCEVAPGIWDVAYPIHPKGWLGFKVRRACRKQGGHWWHPTDAMIEWGCCSCGARRDGVPRDGS